MSPNFCIKLDTLLFWFPIFYMDRVQSIPQFKSLCPLIENSGLFPINLTEFGKNLTTYGKVGSGNNSANSENRAQIMVGGKG